MFPCSYRAAARGGGSDAAAAAGSDSGSGAPATDAGIDAALQRLMQRLKQKHKLGTSLEHCHDALRAIDAAVAAAPATAGLHQQDIDALLPVLKKVVRAWAACGGAWGPCGGAWGPCRGTMAAGGGRMGHAWAAWHPWVHSCMRTPPCSAARPPTRPRVPAANRPPGHKPRRAGRILCRLKRPVEGQAPARADAGAARSDRTGGTQRQPGHGGVRGAADRLLRVSAPRHAARRSTGACACMRAARRRPPRGQPVRGRPPPPGCCAHACDPAATLLAPLSGTRRRPHPFSYAPSPLLSALAREPGLLDALSDHIQAGAAAAGAGGRWGAWHAAARTQAHGALVAPVHAGYGSCQLHACNDSFL